MSDKFVAQIKAGGDRNFTYLFGDGKLCALVDPSYEERRIIKEVKDCKCKLQWILITHSHADHYASAEAIAKQFGARIAAYRTSIAYFDKPLQDKDLLTIGALKVRVLHTPGHTDDSVCYYCEDWLFTGDTLYVGKVGGTDYGKGAAEEYDSIHQVILSLPEDTKIYPGHDYGVRPTSTIREEKKKNPFILRPDFASFLELKIHWLEYKRERGIK
jgi:glyoxylase-like metal-dependent hydrolase (beta-lactamase superfamily II)